MIFSKIDSIMNKIFRAGKDEADEPLTIRKHYTRFRRMLYFIMTAVSFLPFTVTTSLSYYQYRSLLQKEEIANLKLDAESTKRTIEAFIKELQNVLIFVASESSYEELVERDGLRMLFHRFKTVYPGVVDLGVIDDEGVQQAYVGPYDLKGKDYKDRDFFHKVAVRKTFIEPVVMGYRKVPHFGIAVSNINRETNKSWIFRANIDAETLNHFVTKTSTGISEDLFLVTYQGAQELQTTSRLYGESLNPYRLDSIPGRGGVTVTEESSSKGPYAIKAMAYLEGTPWVMVYIKHGYLYGTSWSDFRRQLLLLFVINTVAAIIVIQRTTQLLVNRIRSTDEKREAMLSEMEHTDKLASIGRLAAGVAHEINNPLAIISEKTGLINDMLQFSGDFEYKEKIVHQISGAANAVDRCKAITHRLLGFARRMDVPLERIDLNKLMLEVWGFLDKEALYRGITPQLHLQESLPVIESDRGQLQQIFLNLLNNAIDAIGRDGIITIATKQLNGKFLQADITDNGPGITPEIMKQIFEPFFTTKVGGEKKGTGLGLFITYGLVKKMGGDISVKSTVGSGTTFTITLPVKFTMNPGVSDV